MDPRFLRSRNALRDAVYALAAKKPASEISAAELSDAARVTRATLYRHAASPVALLTDALREELEELVQEHQDAAGEIAVEGGLRGALRILVEHVGSRAEIYRGLMQPSILPPMRANLQQVVMSALRAHAIHHPQILPATVDASDEFSISMMATFIAAGAVGALELWLSVPEVTVDRGTELILAAAPAFWFTSDVDDVVAI